MHVDAAVTKANALQIAHGPTKKILTQTSTAPTTACPATHWSSFPVSERNPEAWGPAGVARDRLEEWVEGLKMGTRRRREEREERFAAPWPGCWDRTRSKKQSQRARTLESRVLSAVAPEDLDR